MVPMLRTWRSPIMPARLASAGMVFPISEEEATSAWRVMAPISTAPPATLMPERSRVKFRSTRSDGEERRSFIACTRLWPPARYFASSFLPIAETASFESFARWYWNACIVFLLGGFLQRAPHGLRGGGHRQVLHAERVGDGVHQRGGRADGAGLAAALHAERVVRARRLARVDLE